MVHGVHGLSHSQLLVLILLTLQSFSIFDCKQYNQPDFIIDHLMICLVFLKKKTTHGHHQMVNTEIRLITFFSVKDGKALYSQQKRDQELTVA